MYQPKPIDITQIELPQQLSELTEKLAEHNHDMWAQQRMNDGWTHGSERNDQTKTHPCLVPYDQLPDSEKEYDRITVEGTLKAILSFDYAIRP